MTMITSTLQANSLFDHASLSSRPFTTRSANNKASGSTDLSHPVTNFGHNIWQSNWQADVEKTFDHVPKDKLAFSRSQDTRLNGAVGSKRPQPPSLALPNIKANVQLFGSGFDRRSPIGSERGATRESEPHSARSRSQFESTSLTPTSFSNDSELSAQQAASNLDQRRWKDPFGTGPSRERTNTWLDAPEFQPSLPLQQQDLIRHQVRQLPNSGIDSAHKTQMFNNSTYELLNGWDAYEKDDVFFERNEFRPVLSAGMVIGRHGNHASSYLSGAQNVHDLDASFARLAVDREGRQPSLSRNELQSSTAARTRFPSFNAQDRQHAFPQIPGTWNGRTYVQNQGLQSADSNSSRQDPDNPRLSTMNVSGIPPSQHNNMMQKNTHPSYLASRSQSSNTQYNYQISEFRPTGTNLYASHVYDTALYSASANPAAVTEYKGTNYNFDSTIGNSYEVYSPVTRTPPESSQAVRSALLEEFRMHGRTKKYELKDIFGHIVEFSGDQLGSRFIQHKLEVANSEEKDRVFQEIASDCRQLMTDLFGNYVIQKLFEHGNQSQKKVLAGHMKGHMMALSTQTYGCRVVQKALDHVLTDQQASLIKELDGHVLKVVDDQNGNHVIQKAIERIPGEHIQFIVDAHRGHVHSLSKHAYGCRVIQRMLEHCEPHAKRAILDELHANIGDLIQDPFGNYVVQHVIVNGETHDRRPVIDKVQSRLLENAMHKFASNVVEKALDYAEEDQSRMMLQTLTGRDEHGQSQIIKLLSHQYGNYVIQKTAAYLNGQALQNLLEEMEQYLTQLRRVSTGKQTTALEASIRDARARLHTQRHLNMILHAPTEPSRYSSVRR